MTEKGVGEGKGSAASTVDERGPLTSARGAPKDERTTDRESKTDADLVRASQFESYGAEDNDGFGDGESLLRAVAFAPELTGAAASDTSDDVEEDTPFASLRFEALTRLGAGTFGVVHKVHDKERGVELALKLLRGTGSKWLRRFKQEFRALTGLVHPNLVTLYDLFVDASGRAFFTMELIDGVDLREWVRARPGEAAPVREQRLRSALLQLARALCALHEVGMVHRDVKPSNVLVTRDGRVVLLDFGLVFDAGSSVTFDGNAICGTPAYMAPEQAASGAGSPASDWYALGVILYEALTARLPYEGATADVLRSKQEGDAPRADELAKDAPADLALLCHDLLQRLPGARPNGAEVLERLGGAEEDRVAPLGAQARTPPYSSDSWPHAGSAVARGGGHGFSTSTGPVPTRGASTAAREVTFVGRKAELSVLHEALASASAAPVWAVIEGSSGMGKSALTARFLEELRASRAPALVLSGRCYERESVPFKALDGIIDALVQHLRELPSHEAALLVPPGMAALARVFPVLAGAGALAGERGDGRVGDAREGLHEAGRALRALLGKLARARPVVVTIDDLQWGDLDSAELLGAVLDSADAPSVLLLTNQRGEESPTNPVLRAFAALRERLRLRVRAVDVSLARLPANDARALALLLLQDVKHAQLAEAIAADAGGSPYLIDELCRYGSEERSQVDLDRALLARMALLPVEARRLLDTLAVAGQPIAAAAAFRSADLPSADPAIVARLRAARFARSRIYGGEELLECYHDRVRETLVADLSSTSLRARHGAIAEALVARTHFDPESVAGHFLAAGAVRRGATYLEAAAEQADLALAFDRAARLYREALEAVPGRDETESRALWKKLAEASANAGHGADAAKAYFHLAESATLEHAATYRRIGAEMLCRGGRIAEGIEASKHALELVGLRWPKGRLRVLLRLVFDRIRLYFRGYRFNLVRGADIDESVKIRLDTGYFFSNFLNAIHPLGAAALHTESLLCALKAGDAPRIGRLLGPEALLRACRKGRDAKVDALLKQAEVLTAGAEPAIRAQALAGRAALAAGTSDFAEARDFAAAAERICLHECKGQLTEAALVRFVRQVSLFYLGEWRALRVAYEAHRLDCLQRDDLLWRYVGAAHVGWIEPLMADDPDAAMNVADEVADLERRTGASISFASPLMVRSWVHRYRGEGALALQALDELWPKLRHQGVRWVLVLDLRTRSDRASAALSALAEGTHGEKGRRRFVSIAEGEVVHIERMKLTVAPGYAALVRAALAHLRGDRPRAIGLLGEARQHLLGADLKGHAAAAERKLGELVGGEEGKALIRRADGQLAAEGIKRPDRVAAMLVPGFSLPD